MPAYKYGEMKWSEMTDAQRQDATGGDRSKHMAKKDKYEARVENKAAASTAAAPTSSSSPATVAAKEKAQTVLNAANTTGDPNKFPDGSPRDPVTGNAPASSSSSPSSSSTTFTGGGITYDNSEAGKARFDGKDVANLKGQGYSDDQISEYAQSLDRGQVGAAAQVQTGAHLPNDVSNLDNYDPMSIGNTKVARGGVQTGSDLQKSELQHLMEEGGHSAYELNEWAKSNQYTLGGKAQKFLNKQLETPTTDVTAPPDEEPDINTNPDIVTKHKNESGGGYESDFDFDPYPITTQAVGENGTGVPVTVGGPWDDPDTTTAALWENGGNIDIEGPPNYTMAVGENGGGIPITSEPNVNPGIGGNADDSIIGVGNAEGDDNQVVSGDNNVVVDGDTDDSVFVAGDNTGQIANDGGIAMGDNSSIDAQIGSNKGDSYVGDFSMGDGSSFIGNYQPNADYSVTIGNQTFGGGSTPGGTGTTGFNNMQNAASYTALNNNQWAQSQNTLNGMTRAAQASLQGNLQTNADARINAYDFNAQSQPETWKQRMKDMQANLFGSTSQYPTFTWNNPTKADPIQTTYNT